MADEIKIEFDNIEGLRRAAELAPKRVIATLKQEMNREGAKFQTEFRKTFLFGAPGINLPRRQATFTKKGKLQKSKKRKDKDARTTQLANVVVKSISGKTGLVLVAYLSRFLVYHRKKLEAGFTTMFKAIEPALHARVEKEAARITQAVLDKGLRDAKRGRR